MKSKKNMSHNHKAHSFNTTKESKDDKIVNNFGIKITNKKNEKYFNQFSEDSDVKNSSEEDNNSKKKKRKNSDSKINLTFKQNKFKGKIKFFIIDFFSEDNNPTKIEKELDIILLDNNQITEILLDYNESKEIEETKAKQLLKMDEIKFNENKIIKIKEKNISLKPTNKIENLDFIQFKKVEEKETLSNDNSK